MLSNIKKIGKNQFGYWLIGTLTYNGFIITDIFNTNLTSELDTSQTYEVKMVEISKSKDKNIRLKLIF